MEEEQIKLKDENDDIINSLVAERDEILQDKFAVQTKLEEKIEGLFSDQFIIQ